MKKYIYILAAAAAFVGCAKEVTPTEEIQNQKPETGVKTVTFTASIESPDTKGTIASGGAFTWSDTDEIAVWTNVGKKTATASKISGGIAEFTFTLGEGESIAEGAILVYPADRLTAATTVNFDPHVFDSADAPAAEPILAAKVGSDRTELKFKYVCGTVQIPFADIPCAANKIYIQQPYGSLGGNGDISFIDHDSNSATDEVPSYSGSFADNVSIYLTSCGHKTVILPVLNTATHNLYVSLKDENVLLFDKTTSLTVQRNSYFKMKELSVSPNVYLYSNMTGWSGTDAPMTVNNGVASLKLTSLGSQYFRVAVEMSGNTYVYGATGADITTLPATLVLNGTDKAVKISDDLGVYTISFDYTTAQASVTKETENPVFYTGSDSMSSMVEMTLLSSTKAYNVRKWQNNIYAYYNQYTASRAHWDLGSGDKYYLFLYNANTNALTPQYFTASDKSWTNVWIEYTTDNWTNRTKLEMDNVSGTPIWSKEITLSGDAKFYFRGKGSNWEDDQSRGTILSISGYTATVGAVDGTANDYSIAAGTYTFLFCEDGRQLVVLNHS